MSADLETATSQAPAKRGPKPRQYFRAVFGITDGPNHFTDGVVFVGSPALLAHFDATGGVDAGRTLYVPSTAEAYQAYEEQRKAELTAQESAQPLVAPTPQTDQIHNGDQQTFGFPDLPPPGEPVIGGIPGGMA